MDTLKALCPSAKTISDLLIGVYSSAIFLLVLSLLKPRLRIGDTLAYKFDPTLPEGKQHHYSFKLINKPVFFKIYDIKRRAWISRIEPSTNADDISFQQINVTKDYQWILNRLHFRHLFQDLILGRSRLEKRTDYAAQFSTYDDLRAMITNGNYITIEIISKHSLTGFTRVKSKKYKHISNISNGSYYNGNSCNIHV